MAELFLQIGAPEHTVAKTRFILSTAPTRTMASPAKSPGKGHVVALGNPCRPGSASPKKLVVYEQREEEFGTNPSGTAQDPDKIKRIEKFCLDHIGVETPDDSILKEIFDYFDKDGSGALDKAEFKVVYQASFDNYGAPMTDKDVTRMFEKLDRDNSGSLSYDEFCVLMLSRMKM